MKAIIILITLFPILSFCQDKTSEALIAEGLKKHPIESAILNYEISGDAKGEELLIFDRFGWRSMKKFSMKFDLYGEERRRSQHEITDGKNIYRIDQTDSTYTKRSESRWSTLASQMSPQQASESILFSMGGNHISDSVLLGKEFQVWKFENKSLQELWIWQGITLKRKSKLGGLEIITTVTKIQSDSEVDLSQFFILPESYKIKE